MHLEPARPTDRLLALASDFAGEVTHRIGRVIPLKEQFSALTTEPVDDGRVTVAVVDADTLKARSIPLTVEGRPILRLFVKYNCCWDRGADFLAVEASWFHVRLGDREKDEPLFRYEFVRRPDGLIPASHLQIHAHRDEFLYLLVAGDKGRPKVRQRKGEVPRMSVFHFPLGGHRFRPCIEDVLQALILEFGVDRVDGWRAAIEEGRESWRRTQLKAAVRDAPTDAASVLTDLGWKVVPPDRETRDNLDRLRSF